jgi:hypothetical protein
VVFYEYTLDSCIRAHAAGLKNVLVTAAYIQPGPWRELLAHVDGVRIDLKALSDEFYRDICSATLQPVLDSLLIARDAVRVLEVVHLIIPTLTIPMTRWARCANDSRESGRGHSCIFALFPALRMRNLPDSLETLYRARDIAARRGCITSISATSRSGHGQYPLSGLPRASRGSPGIYVLQTDFQRALPDCKTEITAYGTCNRIETVSSASVVTAAFSPACWPRGRDAGSWDGVDAPNRRVCPRRLRTRYPGPTRPLDPDTGPPASGMEWMTMKNDSSQRPRRPCAAVNRAFRQPNRGGIGSRRV